MAFNPGYPFTQQVAPIQPMAQLMPDTYPQQGQMQMYNGQYVPPTAFPTRQSPSPQPQIFVDPNASPNSQSLALDRRTSWGGPGVVTTYQQQVQWPTTAMVQSPQSPQYPMVPMPNQLAPPPVPAPAPSTTMIYAPYPAQAQLQAPQHHHFHFSLPPSPSPTPSPQPLPPPQLEPQLEPQRPVSRSRSDDGHSRHHRHRRHSHSGAVQVNLYGWEKAKPPFSERVLNNLTGHSQLNEPRYTGRLVPLLPPNTRLMLPAHGWH